MTFSDEVLSSYLDGEAGPVLSQQIEAAMQADPQLVARMERLGRNDALLREAFDEVLDAAPERLSAALATRPAATVLPLRARPAGRRASSWPGLAAASLAALAIGALIGLAVAPRRAPLVGPAPGGGLAAGGRLAAALASTPSGAEGPVGAEKLTVALSFRSRDGRLCRQFRLASARAGADGVACHGRDDWRIEGWMSSAAGSAPVDGYRTAGGPETSPIIGVVDRLGVAQALDRTAEAAAIRSGWK